MGAKALSWKKTKEYAARQIGRRGAKTDRRIGDVAVTSETNVVRIDTLSYRGN